MTGVPPSTPLREWTIGLEPWIVQDGNYGEFAVDETHEFAVEFHPWDVAVAEPRRRAAQHLGGRRYRVDAPVVFFAGELWMIDVGVLAYCSGSTPEGLAQGTWLSGEIVLGIDPFSYFEWPAADPVPPAIYTWRIAGIRELSAPAPPKDVYLSPEQMEWTAREVRRTNAWDDRGDPVLTYEMACELIDLPPKRQFSSGRR
jgi:hypothetical protein